MLLSWRNSHLALPGTPHCGISMTNHRKKRKRLKNLNSHMRRLRSDMEEISKDQKMIKEGQRQVREKFAAVELECEQLRKETNLIMQQSANTQIRLAFMFQILKARANEEFDKAAKLTCALRELIARDNKQTKTMAPVAGTCSNK
ncbi:uncharacterized protein LOC110427573 [Herrania umbratica]|uniref:Uncharacterized protein LOC110427573 n=1 Tax=Herrania umbratica TaxID=108875 RepID=A0A6J1BH14_9ROSI|nr:uncharacterized protein LOC110427573 [Herrania umbratica]XP_021298803.1 uncharacterized protein LOC110427573 [Herrania umbratica]